MGPWAAAVAWTSAVAALLVASGLLTRQIARRGADGRLGPNQVAGIRTAATLHSEETWLAAHRAGLGPSVAGSWLLVVAGPVGLVAGAGAAVAVGDDRVGAYQLAFTVGMLAAVAAGVVLFLVGARRGHRAARAVMDATP